MSIGPSEGEMEPGDTVAEDEASAEAAHRRDVGGPPPADPRGRISKLDGRNVRGWFFDPARPTEKPQVELLVDGEVHKVVTANELRSYLARETGGDGYHGFSGRLPLALFDGARHDVGARVVGSDRQLKGGLSDVVLSAPAAGSFRYRIVSAEDGVVSGYCYNADAPDDPVVLAIVCDGTMTGRVPAGLPFDGEGVPPEHGFRIALADHVDGPWWSTTIEIEIFHNGHVLAHDFGHLGRTATPIEIAYLSDDLVEGVLKAPGAGGAGAAVNVYLNDALVDVLTDDGAGHYRFSVDRDPESMQPQVLRFTEAASGAPLGRRVSVDVPRAGNLIEDPRFAAWDGADLRHWQRDAGIAALPSAHGGGTAVHFDLGEDVAAERVALLHQDVLLTGLAPDTRRLNLGVAAWSNGPCTIEAALELVGADGTTAVAAAETRVFNGATDRVWRMLLPAPIGAFRPGARLRLSRVGAGASIVRLDFVGLGAPGVDLVDDAAATWRNTPGPFNAVVNAEFETWSGPLRQFGTAERLRLGDAWGLFQSHLNPSLSVRLDKMIIRDPVSGMPGREGFGIVLSGAIPEGVVRLEASLEEVNLRRHGATEFRFFAKGAAGSRVERVSIVRRRLEEGSPEDASAPSDTPICTLAARVDLRTFGSVQSFQLSNAVSNLIRNAAAATAADPSSVLLLVFEFREFVDCAISSVTLSAHAAIDPEAASAHVRLEDDNILRQVAGVKLLEPWMASTVPVRPAVDQQVAAAAVPWHRPSRSFPSVDIVICVYNAHDEVAECIASIVANTRVPHTLTLVDDASQATTATLLDEMAAGRPWIRVLRNPENLGYTRSANRGLSNSDAEWVVLLNSDTIVTPGWLERLVQCGTSDPQIAFVGPLSNAASWQSIPEVMSPAGGWMVNLLPPGISPGDMAEIIRAESRSAYPDVPLLNGFCTLMRASVLEELGYLDEAAFPFGYGEENDLCLRATAAGYRLVLADDVYVYHAKSASFGNERRQELSKAGTRALAAKHPDLDMGEVKHALANLTPIIDLRSRVRTRLAELGYDHAGLAILSKG